ncbi:unnamed protein product [Spirodela intermedia]|uniref:Uncharacterized protein n=1 Tax=Spirodela intermedia TaxID=51605 RepID=A0A7I8JH83_SPIIN|nr:unnamed protein product [Spirodela intermedia]CAA6669291.1 unnamed protein product [Spirodela intermedia]
MADASPKFHPQDLLPPSPGPAVEVAVAHDGLSFWQFMVAGSIAGLVEHTAMFPVDTVKTPSLSLRQAVSSILRTEGPLGFYRGIGAMGLGAGPAHAIYFSVYEISKDPRLFGVLATVASDAVFTPMDTVKQRLQLRSSPYKGVVDCVGRVFREEGFRAFYASYRTTVVMNAPFTAVHFATYEAAKRGLTEVSPDSADDGSLVVHATAGAAAGALAASVTTPLDVIKTQLQCQRDGYGGLMRGWKPRMLFHAPAAAICWSAYESSKSFFQELNNRDRTQ